MPILLPPEVLQSYSEGGKARVGRRLPSLLLLAVPAGVFIALAGAASYVVAFGQDTMSAVRLSSGMIFPAGLVMVLLTGTELFTGNTMLLMSFFDRRIALTHLLRNWGLVYLGNFLGAFLVAALVAGSGLLQTGEGGLGVYFVRMAVYKASLPFDRAFLSAILCNVLVCTGVLCGLSARDTAGRVLGAYCPVMLFAIGGFEHSVANMFFIPVGILANAQGDIAALAAAEGLDTSVLTAAGVLNNLLPVTLGNLVGGIALGLCLWAGHRQLTVDS